MKILELRKGIDNIDSQIIELLNKRALSVKKIGELKAKSGKTVYVPDREAEIYKNILNVNKGPLSAKYIRAIYREIMSCSLSLEKSLVVAFLGPEATFTHIAAIEKFGSQVEYASCNSITAVFREVEVGRVDYGVIPVENSIEGAVTHTLDMFITSDLKICSEVLLDISHNLLGKGEIVMTKKVYSNPQVFGQCRAWLDVHLSNVELVEVSTTSKAAELAGKENGACAIGSILAGERYNLKVLARDIQDNVNNITRFLVIGKDIPSPTKDDKTSIMFSVKDKVGALHDMLAPFKRQGVNLTKIESRPSKKKMWEYYFFVDMLGHYQDEKVRKSLNQLEKQCTFFKVLGSYPIN